MRRKVLGAMFMAFSLGTASVVSAAPSIGQIIPEAPKVEEGDIEDGGMQLVVKEVTTERYENETVVSVVEKANDENTIVSVKDVLTELKVDTKAEEISTPNEKLVNPVLYDALSPFVDLVLADEDEISYEMSGSVKVSLTFEAAKETEKEDLLLMQIDTKTGKVYFAAPEELDKKTGEMKVTLETLGPVQLINKVPVVVKNTAPEDYDNEAVSEVITGYQETKTDIKPVDVIQNMKDIMKRIAIEIREAEGETVSEEDKEQIGLEISVLTTNGQTVDPENPIITLTHKTEVDLTDHIAAGIDPENPIITLEDGRKIDLTDYVTEDGQIEMENPVITLEKEVEIDLTNYTSAMGFADTAIKYGDGYLYDMDGELDIHMHRDIADVDWERIVSAGYADFDLAVAANEPKLLTELEPFVIEGSFYLVVDSVTGEIEIIYEPELEFIMLEFDDEEEVEEESEEVVSEELENEEETEEAEAETEESETEEELETKGELETEDAAEIEELETEKFELKKDRSLMNWIASHESRDKDSRTPELVIKGTTKKMGPGSFFMPEKQK